MLVIALSLIGAITIGVGWVLQHHVIEPGEDADDLGVDTAAQLRLRDLLRRPWWWAGIAAMSIGQTLTGIALQTGALTLVAPLVATNLLCAFLARAVLVRHRPRLQDLAGAIGLIAAVAGFVLVGGPHVTRGSHLAAPAVSGTVAAGAVVLAVGLALAGTGRGVVAVSVTAAVAAGVLYGLQDVATRAGMLHLRRHGLSLTVTSLWPYLLLGSAAVAVLLTQRAFAAARLDCALPPIAATQPVLGVVLGVLLLHDRLALTTPALAVEATCLALLIASAALLARSAALRPRPRRTRGHGRRNRPADAARSAP